MKTCLRVVCLGISVLCTVFYATPADGQGISDDLFNPVGVQPVMADVNVGWPGRVWFQANLAEDGLGYMGSYLTLGIKQRLWQDFLDGRWLFEARGHYDPEYEGFFTNIGVERVFSLESAGAEVSTGFWIDYDDDQQGSFAHSMTALAVNGSIETRRWAVNGNGYFPIGTSDYNQGDPLNGHCFLNHSIVTQAGIDSALRGFDGLLEIKPQALGHVNGKVGIGGYGYGSDLVDFFGGVRGRMSMQLNGGLIVQAEVNHDNRFDLTGVLQVGWLFGGSARGTEYGLLGTDLEPTLRNDHIVRFQQDLMLAIDPDTGRAYDVYHVDNLATPGGDGSFERPFDNLKAAELASTTDDIIFVREGGGTTRNMDQGINLKDGQLLLGDGVQHLIPLIDGTNFILCNDLDGNRPRITNNTFGDAINLANRNTVRGFIIDGTGAAMVHGISGDGVARGSAIRDGIIEDVTITGEPILNGIFLDTIAGNWRFARNDIQTAFNDGIFIDNAVDATSFFTFDSNIVSNNGINGFNGRDGIHMEDFSAARITFINNTTNSNVRDGIRLQNHNDILGTGVSIDFFNPVANANQRDGISLEGVSGNIRFINSSIANNLNGGINLVDVTTPGASQSVFIGTSGGGTSVLDGNGVGTGAGIFNDLGVAFGTQQLLITDTTIQNGGSGIVSRASNIGSNLDTRIIDNLSINNNSTDGINLSADGGATHTATVLNNAGQLAITNNGGNGISISSSGAGPISLVQANIQNVNITNAGTNGIQGSVADDGQAIVQVINSGINGAIDGINITADNDNSAAVSQFLFDEMIIQNVGGDGADVNVLGQTFLDFSLTNSTLTNTQAGNSGIELFAVGDAALTTDTRLRALIVGNTINGFDTGQGLSILGSGDAHILAEITGNNIANNGFNITPTGVPQVAFGDGIDITATDSSEIFTRIVNNNISGNGEQGLDLTTLGTGQITALVTGNFIANNDTQDDTVTTPLVSEAGIADMTANNAVGGTICVAMSSNFFNLPVIFANGAGPANFVVELDGLTNGLGVPVFTPNIAAFTIGTFSTVCTPAIVVEEAAFGLNGFPPKP